MTMRRIAALLLLLCLALSLCACGAKEEAQAPANMESTLPGTTAEESAAVADEAPAAESTAEADPLAETKAAILALKDHPVAELYELIGEPESSDYAPSCLGPGEDGCLYYEGFTVYTYRENGNEVVYDVE